MTYRKFFWLIVLTFVLVCVFGCEIRPPQDHQTANAAPPTPSYRSEAPGAPQVNRTLVRVFYRVRTVRHPVRVKKHRIRLIEG